MSRLVNQRIVIAGGSGFLGTSVASWLHRSGAEVTVLSRSPPPVRRGWSHHGWDGRTTGDWIRVLDGADVIVNLAGRTVNCVKTPDHQDEILRSRVESTRVLGEAMRQIPSPPPTWIQMSTAHIYGDPPREVCDETSAEGIGLAPTVARAWEAAFADAKLDQQRGVVLRTSFVVGRDLGAGGGALGTLHALTRWGLGGRVAAGNQGMSWIHETDFNRLIELAIRDPELSGTYIVSSPYPVSQREFMQTLRRVIGMPIGLPAFSWMVRLAAPLILRTDPELVLFGRYVVSRRLAAHPFEFQFPHLEPALSDLLNSPSATTGQNSAAS